MSDTATPNSSVNQVSPWSNFFNMIVAPSEAFANIRQHPALLYPLILIAASFALAMIYYYTKVDFEWMVDDMASMVPPDTPEEAREAMRDGMTKMGPTFFMAIAAVQGALTYLVVWTLGAAYLSVVSAVKNDGFKFQDWLALEAWSAVPVLFIILAMVVNILLNSDGQISALELNPLSLNNLIFQIPAGQPGATTLSSIHIATIWCAGLKIIGYSQWTSRSFINAAVIILIPYVVWFGGMALMAIF